MVCFCRRAASVLDVEALLGRDCDRRTEQEACSTRLRTPFLSSYAATSCAAGAAVPRALYAAPYFAIFNTSPAGS